MAKGYIIEEIRASVRLRDPESGKTVDVPLETGGRWTPVPARSEATPSAPTEREERAPRTADRPSRPDDVPAAKQEPAARTRPRDSTAKAAEDPEKRRKSHRDKGSRAENPGTRRSARSTEANKPEEPESLISEEARGRRVDLSSLKPEDAEAWKALQSNLRHVRGQHGGKKGGLGWEETTDAGRSGLLARSGAGAYKILHAGADTYGLFYEWDNGHFERLACGKAEDLMKFATEHAQSGLSSLAPTRLSLELARLVCGNAEQKASAADRLEPVLREVDEHPQHEHHEPNAHAQRTAGAANEDTAGPMPVDPKMDEQLMASLKKALAELEE